MKNIITLYCVIAKEFRRINIMKIILSLIVSLLMISNVFALTIDDIMSCGEYYYGSGSSEIFREASDMALKELTSQISVRVFSSIKSKIKQTNKKLEQSVEDVLNTYSMATLKNVQTLKFPTDDGIKVFHYIKKSEVEIIFEERKKLIYDIYLKSEEMEETCNIGYALKWYYFASVLMNSLPYQRISHQGIDLTTVIPERINNILLNTEFVFTKVTNLSEKEKVIALKVTYNDNPVSYIEFNFWDGNNQIRVVGKDGNATLHLLGGSIDFEELDISIKYSFYECRDEFKAVGELWDIVKKASFKNKKKIPLVAAAASSIVTEKKESEVESLDGKEEKPIIVKESDDLHLELTDKENCPVAGQILSETFSFINILQTGKVNEIEKNYIEDEFLCEKLQRIVQYNQPILSEYQIKAEINKTITGWEVRKIGVLNEYSTIHSQAFEYIILDFSEEGYLRDVNFGIMDDLYQKFVEQAAFGNDWGNRQIIIKFIERYRTAYLNRDISMINSIFSDDALIIVGRVLKKAATSNLKDVSYQKLNINQPDVEYLRFTKEQYLKRQNLIFQTQDDIHLGYSTFKITKKNKMPGVYGVSMRQHYNSTGYADEGHLFLLIDFYQEMPQIYVRSWQPQEWEEDSLISLSNFKIYK